MKPDDRFKLIFVRTVGNLLVLFCFLGILATFGPALLYELQFRVIQLRGVTFTVESKGHEKGFADILAGNKEQILVPADTAFSLTIPKIGASAKIFPNIDPANTRDFLPILQKGVAHAKGSSFPGLGGNIYLFAHSTDNWWNVGRYNAVFYLLKDLKVGDEIVVFFEDKRFDYVVSQSSVVAPEDTSLITHHTNTEQLILQTCWPPGTTWKRLFVIARPKG